MAAPMLWLAVPYSVGRLREEMSVDLALNAVCLAAMAITTSLPLFLLLRLLAGTLPPMRATSLRASSNGHARAASARERSIWDMDRAN